MKVKLLLGIVLLFAGGSRVSAQSIFEVDTVNNLEDANPGDGICATSLGDCSLFAAIEEANATPNTGVRDKIYFTNIPLTGSVAEIEIVGTSLPVIREAVLIDATTAPGEVFLNGINGPLINGYYAIKLDPGSDGSIIKGLTIGNFLSTGLYINSNNNIIRQNYIGVDRNGANIANGSYNIEVLGDGNLIGGVEEGNVIGYFSHGIYVLSGNANVIRGNYIGTDGAGQNFGLSVGIYIHRGDDNTVGGPLPAHGNVVGFSNTGIKVGDASRTKVQNNLLGTDSTGTDMGNVYGIDISEGEDNLIGGVQARGNTIGFNRIGIDVSRSIDFKIQGNFIGTNQAGEDLGNEEHGINISESSDGRIGYNGSASIPANTAKGNVIAYNGLHGVLVINSFPIDTSSDNVSIRGNTMYENGELGVDLGNDGLTANDADDSDDGANKYMNFPDINRVDYNGGFDVVAVEYSVSSDSSIVAYPLTVDAYLVDDVASGAGKTFIGTDSYATPGQVQRLDIDATSFSWVSTDRIVLTATDAAGNTSEFSPPTDEISGPGNPIIANTSRDGLQIGDEQPAQFSLSQAYPNPFNPQTSFTVTLPTSLHIRITVHDALGRRIATLHNGQLSAHAHTLTFDASDVASGTYLLRVAGERFVETRRLILVK